MRWNPFPPRGASVVSIPNAALTGQTRVIAVCISATPLPSAASDRSDRGLRSHPTTPPSTSPADTAALTI
jgi:hypothetical protein